MTEVISVRRARPDDSEAATGLARIAKAHWQYPAEWLEAWKSDLTLSPDYLAANRAFVAEIAGEVVGVAVVEEHADHWQIEHVWVDPAMHRRGIGKQLVQRCIDLARAVRPAAMHVVADPYAEQFYLRLGASRIGSVAAPMPGAPDRELPLLSFS